MSIADMCMQTITIEKSVTTSGNAGGTSAVFSTRSVGGVAMSDIPASIQCQTGRLVDTFAQRGIAITHAIYSDTDLSAVRLGDRVIDQGEKYYVVKYVKDMGAQGRGWALYVDDITPAG